MKRRFSDGLPLLDPVEDMGIKDEGLKTVVRVCICCQFFTDCLRETCSSVEKFALA